jgi:ribonuclease HII
MKYLVGIDEAGRGPLAGPVAVGAVIVARDFDFSRVAGVRDSKKLTPESREKWYATLMELSAAGELRFSVSFSSAHSIDTRGIVPAIRSALSRCLEKLDAHPEECDVRLDGSLSAPKHFTQQTTIIRGDDLEPVISLASIAAKVERDRYMRRIAARYPAYGFDIHKGYGTKNHRAAIKERGFCDLHRTTFCTRLFGAEPEGEIAEALQSEEISV